MPGSKQSIIGRCEDLIRSFNPVTHSIDTHCAEVLGDVTLPVRYIFFRWDFDNLSFNIILECKS